MGTLTVTQGYLLILGTEDDCSPDVVYTSDQFSWKQWRKATILSLKRQKPLTNSLDGMYFPCADRMPLVRWDEGRADTLKWHTFVLGESRRGVSFTRDGVGFHPTGVWRYIGCLY